MHIEIGRSGEPIITIEEVKDPAAVEGSRERFERGRRNDEWLQAHWGDLLPRALGKFVALAGQEAFVADTPEDAWAWAARTHPDDDSATVLYVRPEQGPRIYAHRR
jgi:hypothetical protein